MLFEGTIFGVLMLVGGIPLDARALQLSSDQQYDHDESDDHRSCGDLVGDVLAALPQIFRRSIVDPVLGRDAANGSVPDRAVLLIGSIRRDWPRMIGTRPHLAMKLVR